MQPIKHVKHRNHLRDDGGSSCQASESEASYDVEEDSRRRPTTHPTSPRWFQTIDGWTVDVPSRRHRIHLAALLPIRPTVVPYEALNWNVLPLRLQLDKLRDSNCPRGPLDPPADLTFWTLIGQLSQVVLRDWSRLSLAEVSSEMFVPMTESAETTHCYGNWQFIVWIWYTTWHNGSKYQKTKRSHNVT